MTDEPCLFLQWDTDFFGYRIARAAVSALDDQTVKSIYNWCELHRIECLYFLAGAEDRQTIRLAENNGFRLVEIRLNMERSLRAWDPETRPRQAEDVIIRNATPEDVPVCQDIARTSYVDSRYYFDEHFSEEKWQAYYATWIKKSLQGGAELALVAEKDNQVVGYITGVLSKEKPEAMYELTGVRETARKAGVGQELFRAGLDWYVRHGIQYVWLATQGRNVPTQRMVQRNGLITRSCQLYYHKWFVD
ncbi:MAG: GNAT family N-acetyltransferase [Anaerolineales bacterium]|nr:GNAT family N-acetyltransferase [Anaerolineales bacterium]